MLNDEADHLNAFIEIHAGAGGTESQDWAEMLQRMYLRWSDNQENCEVLLLQEMRGEEAGIKSCTLKIVMNYSYGWLKNESGNNLELDVFFPELNLAFEYHGRQHREHVPFFGTVNDFERQKRNDEIKRKKCKLRGISLIEIWFDDPLNKTFINRKIKESKSQPVTSSLNNKSNVTVLKKSTPINVTETDGNLPCLTCGFSKCNMDYHYGA